MEAGEGVEAARAELRALADDGRAAGVARFFKTGPASTARATGSSA